VSPGPILARRATSLDIESDEHQMLERFFVAALFLLPAIVVALVARQPVQRLVYGAAVTVVFAVALEAVLAAASGRTFAVAGVLDTMLIGAAPMALFGLTARVPRP
jgi:hypothetical protein